MTTPRTAESLISARNALSGNCSPLIHAALRMPVASAAAALIDAAERFIRAARAAQDAILGPTNWRAEIDGMDEALKAVGA
jgi:hypothetical protein